MTTAITKAGVAQLARAEDGLTDEQVELIKRTIAKGASNDELALFIQQCNRMRLDPFARQIFLVRRYDSQLDNGHGREKGGYVAQTQVSVDGLRLVAERTGKYRGQTQPLWCGDDGVWKDVWLAQEPPRAAKVGVYREGFAEPLTRVATYLSYVQEKRGGGPNSMWAKYPDVMLSKCFDEATEVLTDAGFQRFAEVTGRILQVTERGLESTHARPFVQDYDGPMVTLESDDLNFSVTPNHDMVTTQGKIEAGVMFEEARARPRFWIPRSVKGSAAGLGMSDQHITVSAAYLCDGADREGNTFSVSVRRPKKIAALRETSLALGEWTKRVRPSLSAIRTIIPSGDQNAFTFSYEAVAPLCSYGKVVDVDALIRMSRDEARMLVDAMIFFDGHKQTRSGVRRFYTSRVDHKHAFELACVIAGYSISGWKSRASDLSDRPNFYATVSARDEIPVMRWGREYNGDKHATREHTGLSMTPSTGRVWCVTVPSGVIVVRRRGFSMLCGNCAESLALRSAFPNELSGIYTAEELPPPEQDERKPATRPTPQDRLDAIARGGERAVERPATQPPSGPTAEDPPSSPPTASDAISPADGELLDAKAWRDRYEAEAEAAMQQGVIFEQEDDAGLPVPPFDEPRTSKNAKKYPDTAYSQLPGGFVREVIVGHKTFDEMPLGKRLHALYCVARHELAKGRTDAR